MLRRSGSACLAGAIVSLLALPAAAQVQPRPTSPLYEKVHAPAGFVATAAPQPLDQVRAEVSAALLADVEKFEQRNGQAWRYHVDRRSGALALVEGSGIPWIPGGGNILDPALIGSGPAGSWTAADLEPMAREFIAEYPAMFGVPQSQLVLDPGGTVQLGEDGRFRQIAFRQRIEGVPVEQARVVLRLSHGNLVQFGADRVLPAGLQGGPVEAVKTPAEARAAVDAWVGGFASEDVVLEPGRLRWVLRGADDRVGWDGEPGRGWEPILSYRVTFERAGQVGTWQAEVDARTGEVVRFTDSNRYDAVVKASVYTTTNCVDPLNCVPGSEDEVAVTMPFTDLTFAGATCSGDQCYTNSAGAFDHPAGAVSATTTLSGKYFRIVDACGPVTASSVAPDGIDLGTTPADTSGLNTDCTPATQESPPGTGPVFGGLGDTHAARSTFYHLNLINQKSRAYLPHNEWLRGADGPSGPVPTTTNGPPACNAVWQGTTGSLAFFRSTPVLNCNNFGEVPDIFLHEFGHGLDSNDGSGSAPEGGTGEAMGDTFALLQGQNSCAGEGAFIGSTAGYGSTSALCSGVRDLDYTRFCYPGGADGCAPASLDPDVTHGSRSGTAPNLSAPDAGTPARWNHMIAGAPAGVADGQSNFYACGGPEIGGCAGALNHGCHCESLIGSQANWDLARLLVEQKFGGNIYADPQTPTEISGWQYMDRLWYLTRDLASSSYSVTGAAPAGMTNGCSAVNWYSTYRFIDDDDGDLSNGTPHADLIFQAMDLHAIACGTASDATNQSSTCSSIPPAPELSSACTAAPVQLDWTASTGGTEYRVLRNTLGCGFGFTPLSTVGGEQVFFEDAEVATGIPYYYSVQPVGDSRSCYGLASNCIEVVPTDCGAVAAPPPTGITLSTPADNTIRVDWDAVPGAASYKILRKPGDCASGGAFTAIGTVDAPDTTFVDGIGLQGALEYAYQVVSADDACTACTSDPSSCASVEATGSCTLTPTFEGLQVVRADPEARCQLELSWNAATAGCGSAVTYDVFRSTDGDFAPTADTRIATGVTGTVHVDASVAGDVRYYYVVRAVDGLGNGDANTVRKSAVAGGELAPGPYTDDAGDTGAARFAAGQTPGNTWSLRPAGTGNATSQYATTASGPYPNGSCMALESSDIFLGADPTLEFRSRFVIEPNWDGGIVEVSTEAGGFENWTKLDSILYPAVMIGATEVCPGNPGLADGQPAFNGSSVGWQEFSGSLADYANERIRLRFLFGTDEATNDEGWFVDDIVVNDALVPQACVSEVSGRDSGRPLLIGKEAGGTLELVFEDLGEAATSYNVYAGDLGVWYSNTAATCHTTSSMAGVPGPGDRTLTGYTPPGGSVSLLVTGSSAGAEGVAGFDSSGSERSVQAPRCGPTP